MLFNEPKLLKYSAPGGGAISLLGFSALQRAEIAEIVLDDRQVHAASCFSALQRAEIAEMLLVNLRRPAELRFSALQRAEIAEIEPVDNPAERGDGVSVLFNEPKLLKSNSTIQS